MLRRALRTMSCAVLALTLGWGCDRKESPAPDAAPSATAVTSAAPSASARPAKPKVHERVVLSPVYEVDKIYKSMRGPNSTSRVALAPKDDLELLWIVGFEAIMVDPKEGERISQEYMCHTNLDLDVSTHQAAFRHDKKRITGRIFTLSQGQYRIDLPEGFGIPILSSEMMQLNTQVLNLNRPDIDKKVRHKVIMRYVKDRDLSAPMKALFAAGAFGLKLLEGDDGHYGMDHEAHGEDGEDMTACLPGANAGFNQFEDGKGRSFTGHWVVEPGKEVNHTRVTELMDLPFDTTLHYVAVHLHPFAEKLTLLDKTSGKTVYEAKTRQADEGIGLAHVDFFSSPEGIPLFKDHEYELVSEYNNTSGEPQDSMAVMNLYLHDEEFEKPDLEKAKKVLADGGNPTASTAGPMGSAAPAASAHQGHEHHHHGGM